MTQLGWDLPPPSAPIASEVRGSEPSPAAHFADDELFVSPYEDELDVPTFLRRKPSEERAREISKPQDRETPAFLRRSAD
jgi:hypothetical protein